jgi:hypothetical protein
MGEETKPKLTADKAKRHARLTMDRFTCNGWLYVTTDERDLTTINIRITHHLCHTPYVDISIPDNVAELVL